MIPKTVSELQYQIAQTRISPASYSIGEFGDDRSCIVQAPDGDWETFNGERGKKLDLRRWDDEGDACVFFVGTLWAQTMQLLHKDNL
ncbi:hypothetical protein J7E83_17555 [Arthrobacter sp. ISL-48]|uniref:hypothetical protein n=1 Tax=Arthrobacter sp. ISL-48 TaxID=2819110 RepID=UPI001BEB180C|nr:hypothetical protein [Arthrobacter sp. ISL-48]MBT2533897.1 hypothetical protein [Arthrobacter sp. ISL-48]